MRRARPTTYRTNLERFVEAALVPALHARGVQRYYFNYPDFKVAQPDFYIPSLGIVIEVDGYHWHHTTKQRARDARKDRFYKSMGLKVARLPEALVLRSPTMAVAQALEGPWQS